jgi:dihydroorotate dehydrogenase (fumarate)
MADLKTNYLGLNLKNPLLASASPLSKKLANIKKMEDAGIAGVVLYSLFEEEISRESIALDYFLSRETESFAEALTYFPDLDNYNVGPDKYLELISRAKESTQIPIIGSLNGISNSGWVKYAKLIEQAGADALELNIYYVSTDLGMTATKLEEVNIELVKNIREEIKIPLAVKLSPFFTSFSNFASDLASAGVDGLVLFNRFYQPDIDITDMQVKPALQLSNSSDLLLPLRWIAILYKKVNSDLALTSGIHSGEDMVKALMAGATVVMSASEIIDKGIDRAKTMLREFSNWLDINEYESVTSLRGVLSQRSIAQPAAFERANYMKALTLFDNKF